MLAVIDATSDPTSITTGGWEIAAFAISGPPFPDEGTISCAYVTPLLPLVVSAGVVPPEAGSRVLSAAVRQQPALGGLAVLVNVLRGDQTVTQCVLALEMDQSQEREGQLLTVRLVWLCEGHCVSPTREKFKALLTLHACEQTRPRWT
jgi:hypothetical protein